MDYEPSSQAIEKLCSAHKAAEFPATIQDQTDQILSTGIGIFYTPQIGGAYWPERRATLDITGTTELFLKAKDGKKVAIENFHQCPRGLDFHFHFETKK